MVGVAYQRFFKNISLNMVTSYCSYYSCFIGDGQRLILPSFGAYTGGLDIMHPAIANLFPGPFTAWVISQGSIYAFPSEIAHFLPFKS